MANIEEAKQLAQEWLKDRPTSTVHRSTVINPHHAVKFGNDEVLVPNRIPTYEDSWSKVEEVKSALDVQHGGSHYKDCAIQPVEYFEANDLRFLEGSIIKRATRHNHSTGKGAEDVRKIIHEAMLLLELRYGEKYDLS